jgi:hypothetical protein
LYVPDNLSSEVTSQASAHDAGIADEHDDLMPLDDPAGDSSLQRYHLAQTRVTAVKTINGVEKRTPSS